MEEEEEKSTVTIKVESVETPLEDEWRRLKVGVVVERGEDEEIIC